MNFESMILRTLKVRTSSLLISELVPWVVMCIVPQIGAIKFSMAGT